MDLDTRAEEIAFFLEESPELAKARLAEGFHHNHALVAEDFKRAQADVNSSSSLIDWYRNTDAYIWELSAYHLDVGFNYQGMCDGIVNHLSNHDKWQPLMMGDGIGDLTLTAAAAGLWPTYHDLAGAKTSDFARFRIERSEYEEQIDIHLTTDFVPMFSVEQYDAVIALDYFEHVPNVPEWVQVTYDMLKPGGLFMAQNAFGIGDAEHGDSIPMHLSVNNRYVREWDQLLVDTGFIHTGAGTWWQK